MKHEANIIPSYKIDKIKWDECVRKSASALIYAQSFYLDFMSDNWSGIVMNDYETLMPLCWRKKGGIKYLYHVPFIQQLGWFSKNNFTDEDLLMKTVYKFCSYGDYYFNFSNKIEQSFSLCNNYIISLKSNYDLIKNNYSADLNSNLKKTLKENFIYENENIETAIGLFKSLYGKRFQQVKEDDYERFLKLCKFLEKDNNCFARKISNQQNEALAVALLIKDEKRIYNLMNSVTGIGKKSSANHFLIDTIFKEFASRNFIFDFEGSDIEGIKKFYENFGAINQPYFKVHFNRLPMPLKLLKP